MILDEIFKNKPFIEKNANKLKVLLLLATAFFIFPQFSTNKILTHEHLYKKGYNPKHNLKKKPKFEEFKDFYMYQKTEKSPYETILMQGNADQISDFKKIVQFIDNTEILAKNIKIILYKRKIQKDHREQYFAIININFGNASFIKTFPFQNHQPNSDLFFIATCYFRQKPKYRQFFFKKMPNNINVINLNLRPSIKDSKKLYSFLLRISNLHSHSLGSYYYFPYYDNHISVSSVAPFLLLNVVYSCFTAIMNEDFSFELLYLTPAAFMVSPWSLFLFVLSGNVLTFICLVFFSVLNFRFGYIFALFVFIRNLYFFLE